MPLIILMCPTDDYNGFFVLLFKITVWEPIVDFGVGVMYTDKGTGLMKQGLGPDKHQVPLGRNVTFTFSYTTGKVHNYTKH
jgi:hypothetical protein